MIGKIGCRTHDYGSGTMANLAPVLKKDNYETMQLAFRKALVDAGTWDHCLTPSFANEIKTILDGHQLSVSVLGAYLNYGGLDDLKRAANLEILKGHLKVAKELGCRMVGTETGSLDDDYKDHEDNHGTYAFKRFKEAVLMALEVAQEEEVYFAIEAVSHHIIHTPKRMKALLDEVNHPDLKVIFDISNLMTEENVTNQEAIMQEAFDLFGERILVAHIKDFDFIQGEKVILPLGQGKLNLDFLMKLIEDSPVSVDVLAENIPSEELGRSSRLLHAYRERV